MGGERAGRVLAVALAVAGALAVWRGEGDSLATTWRAVAAGAEAVPLAGAVTVWDGDALAVWSAAPLGLARLGGETSAGITYLLFAAALAAFWVEGIRRLAIASGAGGLASGAVAAGAVVWMLAAAGGRHAILGAAPVPWIAAALMRDRSALAITLPLAALAFLSRGAFLLCLPLLAFERLGRAGRGGLSHWTPLAAGVLLYVVFPEPGWSRLLRLELHRTPAAAGGGAEAVPAMAVFGDAPSGALLLAASMAVGVAALAGAAKGGAAVRGLGLAAAALALVAGGFLGAGRFVTALVPALRGYDTPGLGAFLAAAFLLALGARAAPLALLGILLASLAIAPRAVGGPAPVPGTIAAAIAAGGVDTLALPVSIANDRRWRSALPAERRLRNGLQAVLERNAPLLAGALDADDPAATLPILRRLGVRRVVVPAASAGKLGRVLVSAGGESLVELHPSPPRRAACLSSAGWRVGSSQGVPEVSVPERAIDGDPATRWGTGAAQRPGQFYEIDFGEALHLGELELRFRGFETDFPRGIRVEAGGAAGPWRAVHRRHPWRGEIEWIDGFAVPDGGRRGRVRLPLGGVRASRLRIEQTGRTSIEDWSIAEICLRPAGTNADA